MVTHQRIYFESVPAFARGQFVIFEPPFEGLPSATPYWTRPLDRYDPNERSNIAVLRPEIETWLLANFDKADFIWHGGCQHLGFRHAHQAMLFISIWAGYAAPRKDA